MLLVNQFGWLIHVVYLVCRKRVRFDRAAEFLAACASEDTVEASLMLQEVKETKRRNGEDVGEIINCSNADGITALHQVSPVLSSRIHPNYLFIRRPFWNYSLSVVVLQARHLSVLSLTFYEEV